MGMVNKLYEWQLHARLAEKPKDLFAVFGFQLKSHPRFTILTEQYRYLSGPSKQF